MKIKKPIITEKSISMYKNDSKATFEVGGRINKNSAKRELEKMYDIEIEKVWVNNRLGKYKTIKGKRNLAKQSDKKIMVFKLKKGKLDFFEKGE